MNDSILKELKFHKGQGHITIWIVGYMRQTQILRTNDLSHHYFSGTTCQTNHLDQSSITAKPLLLTEVKTELPNSA